MARVGTPAIPARWLAISWRDHTVRWERASTWNASTALARRSERALGPRPRDETRRGLELSGVDLGQLEARGLERGEDVGRAHRSQVPAVGSTRRERRPSTRRRASSSTDSSFQRVCGGRVAPVNARPRALMSPGVRGRSGRCVSSRRTSATVCRTTAPPAPPGPRGRCRRFRRAWAGWRPPGQARQHLVDLVEDRPQLRELAPGHRSAGRHSGPGRVSPEEHAGQARVELDLLQERRGPLHRVARAWTADRDCRQQRARQLDLALEADEGLAGGANARSEDRGRVLAPSRSPRALNVVERARGVL